MSTAASAYREMSGLVRLGLLEFWSRALPEEAGLMSLLRREAESRLGPSAAQTWRTVRDEFQQRWPLTGGPLGRVIQDHQLPLADAFLLTLIGEVESSHVIDLVLCELQAPARNARPTLHLCVAMIEALFERSDTHPFDFSNSSLVREHVISVSGDGPVPLRNLVMPAALWSILCGRTAAWPGCRQLPESDAALLPKRAFAQLQSIAAMLAPVDSGTKAIAGVLLRGHPGSGRGAFAQRLAELLGLRAIEIPAEIWGQQPELAAACRYAGWLPVLRPVVGPGEAWKMPEPGRFPNPVVIVLGTDGAVEAGEILEVELAVPRQSQRRQIWKQHLRNETLSRDAATGQLSGPFIARIAANAQLLAKREGVKLGEKHIAEARGYLSAARLRLLAQPVNRRVGRDALVLPPPVGEALENLLMRARRRESLWKGLGATLAATPNSGVRALFVGESGTGKTLAASYISTALNAPLYRVDLSVVMNKYIGESEKNLAQLLDHAAANDVVLLFDEADSLFGSRSEGRETGERYANMLTNFLLTRIENHPGVVILTTNSRERIDNAFNRRIDVVVEFPLPGYEERLHLWRSHLGNRGPGDGIYRTLASYCDLAGGQLRNAVLAAAARAAGDRIHNEDLLAGLRAEYQKFGRELPAKIERLLAAGEGDHARVSVGTSAAG